LFRLHPGHLRRTFLITAVKTSTATGPGRLAPCIDPAEGRDGYTDLLAATKRKHIIHGLVEIDVTNAHRLLRQREAAGEDLSFTASSSMLSPGRWMRTASCTPTGAAAG
jgi:hypothetical protein